MISEGPPGRHQDARPAFRFGNIEVPIPPLTERVPPRDEKEFIETAQRLWPNFCSIVINQIRFSPPSPIMDLQTFTPEGMQEVFTLSKQSVRNEVLKVSIPQDKLKDSIYRHFALGKPSATGTKHDPHIDITRLELFQLLVLLVARRFCIHKREHLRKSGTRRALAQINQPTDEQLFESFRKTMRRRPEGGGPLMTAR